MSTTAPNGGSWRPDLPTLLRAVGVSGAIAIFVVYVGANEIPRLVRATEQNAAEIAQNRLAIEANSKLGERLLEQNDRLLRTIQAMCANLAKDDGSRRQCF